MLLAVVLPTLNYILKTLLLLKPKIKDLSVAQISCLCLLVGNLVIGLASTDKTMLLGEFSPFSHPWKISTTVALKYFVSGTFDLLTLFT